MIIVGGEQTVASCNSCRLVKLLLCLTLLISEVPWATNYQYAQAAILWISPTRSLLPFITGHSADDWILVTASSVSNALRISLGLGSIVFSLPFGVLFFTGLHPRLHSSHIANLRRKLERCSVWRDASVLFQPRYPSESEIDQWPCCDKVSSGSRQQEEMALTWVLVKIAEKTCLMKC